MVMMGMVVKISFSVCWFPIDINLKFSICPCNYCMKECKFSVVFMFKGELYGWVH